MLAVGFAFLVEVIDIALKNLATRSGIAIPLIYANLLVPFFIAIWLLWRDSAPPRRARSLAAEPAE